MDFGNSPKSPSFKKDRRGWNAAWERELAIVFGSGVEIFSATGPLNSRPSITGGYPPDFYDQMLTDSLVAGIHSLTTAICNLQHELTVEAFERFTEDDFEADWMACCPHEREEFILEGLVRTCEVSSSYESYRTWCPELTLKRLNYGSGKGFIELVEKLCHENLEKIPDDCKTVPNAVFEKTNSVNGPNPHPGCLILKRMLEGRRIYFMTMFCWHVLLAFYGESFEFGHSKNPRGDSDDWKCFQKYLPPEVDLKSIVKQSKADCRRGERHCTSCRLPARIAGVPALLACQPCRSIDREGNYCSKECQTTDWKTGKPPHKTICGKKGAIAAAFVSATSPKFSGAL